MLFHQIFHSIPLLVNKQKELIYKIRKKIGCSLLAGLLTNGVSAIEAGDINNLLSLQTPSGSRYFTQAEMDFASYINFAAAPIQRTFDYDAGLLPEVAEVIFALRIKHVNIGKSFVINLSGNYLLKFTKDKIYILDTYTKNSDVYKYQSTNPNITIGLGVSKGLPRNYKSIIIKEDSHGQLYDYAALYSDNITTDETILRETLSHPFYEIARQDGVENSVKVTKAMAFYQEKPPHSRQARCITSSSTILDQFMELFRSGSAVCGPKSTLDIRSANHKTAAEMKLEKPLVETTVNTNKFPEKLGFRLLKRVDLNDKDPIALLAAAKYCKKSVWMIIRERRKTRSLDDECEYWADLIVGYYRALGLEYKDMNEIVEHVKETNSIPASYFPGRQYPPDKEDHIDLLVSMISKNINTVLKLLQDAAAEEGEAAGASEFQCFAQCQASSESGSAECQASGGSGVAEGGVEIYMLNGYQLLPLPNKVKIVDKENTFNYKIVEAVGQSYTTRVFNLHEHEQINNIEGIISSYIDILKTWIVEIKKRLRSCSKNQRVIFNGGLDIVNAIITTLKDFKWQINNNQVLNGVLSVVYHNDDLIGISVGAIINRTYSTDYQIVSPQSLFINDGSFVEQLHYLRSELLKYLISNGLIDKSEYISISKFNTGHDEL